MDAETKRVYIDATLTIASARFANDRLREALAFYADRVNYENATPRHVRPVISDRGARAREVLGGE